MENKTKILIGIGSAVLVGGLAYLVLKPTSAAAATPKIPSETQRELDKLKYQATEPAVKKPSAEEMLYGLNDYSASYDTSSYYDEYYQQYLDMYYNYGYGNLNDNYIFA